MAAVPESTSAAASEAHQRRADGLALVGILALALNLRPGVLSVGPVLDEIRGDLAMSATVAGLLTTLPVLCFAVFGAVAPGLARLVGVHRVMLLALAGIAVGLGGRALTSSVPVFLAGSTLALAGIATANVMLPSLVKRHFPTRVGRLTALYSTALAIGLTVASVATVPIAAVTGGWRGGLGLWAVLAALAVLPWLGMVARDTKPSQAPHRSVSMRALLRSPLAWAVTWYFALQSLQAYALFGWLPQIFRDAGFSAGTAGALLGVIAAISIPISFLLPSYAARRADQRPLVVWLGGCYVAGYVGLILAPVGGAWLWATLLGIGGGAFPLCLTLFGLRAHTPGAIAALSGFAQSIGYLLAAVGPFGMGLLYDLTGGWTLALWLLVALVVPQIAAGVLAARPRYLEDDLAAQR
jgi:CP family cyanate transporter-like MFS transporter